MIRKARPADASPLASLHRASIRELCAAAYSNEQLAAWTAALEPSMYASLMATSYVVVAVQDGVPVGLGVCDPRESLINAVYVAPGATRRGVGRNLLAVLESRFVEAGVSEARLNATLNAVSFYGALGYSAAGTTTNRLGTGVDLPCMAMTKRLTPDHRVRPKSIKSDVTDGPKEPR
jgi:GNAT superfamily N-acetyltransferase